MTDTRNRQDPFRQALGQSLASPGAESGPDCLDVETLAAWLDDGLTAQQRVAAESHASTCARCQALLAALTQTDPAVAGATEAPVHAPLPFPPPRRARPMLWLLPLAAAAVVVIAIMPKRPANVAPSAATSTSATSPKESETKQVARLEPAPSPAPPVQPTAATRDQDRARTSAEKLDRKDAPKNEATTNARSSELAKTKALADQVPAQPKIAEPQAAPPTPRAAQTAQSANAALRPAGPPLDAVMEQRLIGPIVFATPDDAVRWRLTGSRVEQSTDNGATWHDMPTATTDRLTAGSAPSSFVCWLVGADGTVLVRTDRSASRGGGGGGGGRGGARGGVAGGQVEAPSWRRVDFPEKTDLSSITATDELTATVRTADGREFRTTDGGVTWRQR